MTESVKIFLNEVEIQNLLEVLRYGGRLSGLELSATQTGVGTYLQAVMHSLEHEDIIGVDITDYDCW